MLFFSEGDHADWNAVTPFFHCCLFYLKDKVLKSLKYSMICTFLRFDMMLRDVFYHLVKFNTI